TMPRWMYLGLLANLAFAAPAPLPPPARHPVDFGKDIAPLLSRCHGCHGGRQQLSGLRLDTAEGARRGGYSGPAIRPGSSADSKLIHLVAETTKGRVMPPAGPKLAPAEIGLLRAWIDQGAKWADAGPVPTSSAPVRQTHWSFIRPRRPDVPQPRNRAWIRNPIDAFILDRLDAEGLTPSPEADRPTLIRRVTLDLTGLPPAPDEVAAFLSDNRPDAYERVVERLLRSPHYGERWARHWLDLGRYADSDGYEKDQFRPHAWRYRHWLIEALNRDVPFDQFTIETMAGDLLPDAMADQQTATGFHRNTLTNREGGTNPEQFRFEQTLDRTSTVGAVWLGLTVGCAQCHDHKYDPITQKDLYQLFAFFNTADETYIDAPLPGETGSYFRALPAYGRKRDALYQEYKVHELQAEWETRLRETIANPGKSHEWDFALNVVRVLGDYADRRLLAGPEKRTARENDAMTRQFIQFYGGAIVTKERLKELRWDELKGKLKNLDEELPAFSQAPVLAASPEVRKTHIAIRGDWRDHGIEVQPATPAFLHPAPPGAPATRLTLARWLISRENPLTARVTVNRFWNELFGRGIVRTTEDFGRQGERPSHPELLDWLALEFMDRGWSMKSMHRLMVTSATYRQASALRPDLQAKDPSNLLLARQSRLRLNAECVRDAALLAGGLLNPAIGGKSVRPQQPDGVAALGYAEQGKWVESKGPDRYRRGLYIQFFRTTPYPMLVNFDSPDGNVVCTRRQRSNTPLQALNLLNDPVFFEAAQGLANRLLHEKSGTLRERINYGVEICLSRPATSREQERLAALFEKQQALFQRDSASRALVYPLEGPGINQPEAAAWVAVSRTLLNLDEFITRE
ncbi:MAG: PSD1 and planctomycete cytochrome C domain-containing protein, partial [Bryobacteraceae bacterium]